MRSNRASKTGIQLKMFRKQLTKQFRGLSIIHTVEQCEGSNFSSGSQWLNLVRDEVILRKVNDPDSTPLDSIQLWQFIEDDLTLKETVEDGLRMTLRPACAKIVQSLSSLCDIWCPGFCFIKSFPFVNTHCIQEQNTQGPTPSNRRQDHEDHSTYPFRADAHSIDRWSMS